MRPNQPMLRTLAATASLCCAATCALAQGVFVAPQYPQYRQYPQGGPPVMPAVPEPQVVLTAAQIDQLLGPIALYPDPLLSLVFPASTYPADLIDAQRWLDTVPTPTEAQISEREWDDSIKGLVHYPTVLRMMSDQIDWTQTVGGAFLNQQQGVMESVQRLRALAQAVQNLQTTPQAQVLVEQGIIRIEPADPTIIYVPQYDPYVVYTRSHLISFGFGFPIGRWCDNDFDWDRHHVVIGGGWHNGWRHPPEWDRQRPDWDHTPRGWVPAPREWERTPRRPAPRITHASESHLEHQRPRGDNTPNRGPGPDRSTHSPIGRPGDRQHPDTVFDPPGSREDVDRAKDRAKPRPDPKTPPQPKADRPTPARPTPHDTPADRDPPPVAPPRPAPTDTPRREPTPKPAPKEDAPRREAPRRPAPKEDAPRPAPREDAPRPAPREDAPHRDPAPKPAPAEDAPRREAPPRASAPDSAFEGGSGRADSDRGKESRKH